MTIDHLTDEDFLRAFEECRIANHDFNHTAHIRMAWVYLRKYAMEEAVFRIISGIKRFAAAHHAPKLYHDTITRFWIYSVQNAIQAAPEIQHFPTFLKQNMHLADKTLINVFYTIELLGSPAARQHWWNRI